MREWFGSAGARRIREEVRTSRMRACGPFIAPYAENDFERQRLENEADADESKAGNQDRAGSLALPALEGNLAIPNDPDARRDNCRSKPAAARVGVDAHVARRANDHSVAETACGFGSRQPARAPRGTPKRLT